MISFEGRYKSKRQPPYVVDSKRLIQLKQEERRQRARVTREELAATCIQSFIRGVISRRRTVSYFRQLFEQLSEQILLIKECHSEDSSYTQSICTCLRAFQITGSSCISYQEAATISRVLLSPTCQALYSHWLSVSETPILFTITQIFIQLLFYLRNLPPNVPSKLYVLPVRVLEIYLRKDVAGSSEAANACLSRLLLTLCQRGRYCFNLAIFIDQQSLKADHDNLLEDFFRHPKNRALIDLLKIPFKCCLPREASDSSLPIVTQQFLSSALNDVTLATHGSVKSLDQFSGSGISRLVLPVLLAAIPRELLIGQLYASAIGEAYQNPSGDKLQPSMTLLHRFMCEIVPSLLMVSPQLPQASALPNFEGEAIDEEQVELILQQQIWASPQGTSDARADSSLVLVVLRILAWMFSALISARCPSTDDTAPFSPPFAIPSLRHNGEIDQDRDSENDVNDKVNQESGHLAGAGSACSNEAFSRFENAWPGQMTEIFASLQKYLPSLSGIALRELYNSSLSIHPQRQEIILCLAILHSMLSFVKSTSSSHMIPLNSVLSQFPEFLRDLWDLTQTFSVSSPNSCSSSAGGGNAVLMREPSIRFFDLISSGEHSKLHENLHLYTAVVLTFVDCLRHRLLCLTDLEINCPNSTTSMATCGFAPNELLLMGQRLRNLMLGLIDLAYPASRTKPRRGQRGCAEESGENSSLQAILTRIRYQRTTGFRTLVDSATPCDTDAEAQRLRWCLHRWTVLFTHTQALVTLIYDWDHRRQGREAVNLSRSQRDGQESIWLKPDAISTIQLHKLPSWLVGRAGVGGAFAMAGAPFGYYSCLNVDLDLAISTLGMSYMDWRQMTTLMELPFVITFWQRVQIFQSLVSNSRRSVQGSFVNTWDYVPETINGRYAPIHIRVRRGYLYEDTFENLSKENVPFLHPRLNVTFYNQAGVLEMGMDGGGLSREFLTQAIAEGFNPTRGFFLYTDDNALYPNPNASAVNPDYLKHYFFLGRILAKAIYEGMLVEVRFAHFFLAKLVSRAEGFSVGFDYLRSLDMELYRHLCSLKTYEGNVRDLELDFTTVHSVFGETKSIELKPGGSSIPVTNATRVEYVHLVANYKLNRQIYRQSKAFFTGMADVVSLDWLRLFDAEELQVLISGADTDINVDDLKAHTKYVGDLTVSNNQTVEHFWQIMDSFTQEQKRSLLLFVTACSRPPMFGFQDLQPPFSIQLVPETDRLPTSSTCMNLLKLPAYEDLEVLSEKLLFSLNSNAGFEYS